MAPTVSECALHETAEYNMNNRQSGVTFIEMIGTMVIAGILLAMANVGMGYLAASKTIAEANRMLIDIQYARSEAIKWGEVAGMCIADSIQFCDTNSPSTCKCKAGAAAKTYHDGWLIFIDADRNGRFDADTETLLRVGWPPSTGVEMHSNNAIQMGLSLNASGEFLSGDAEGKVYVCYEGDSTAEIPGRRVIVHLSGRTEVQTMAAGESCNPHPVQD